MGSIYFHIDKKIISNYFSNKKPLWDDTKYFFSKKNIPMIKNSVVNIECQPTKKLNHGDHIIFICKISEILINDKQKPLIYLNSKYL